MEGGPIHLTVQVVRIADGDEVAFQFMPPYPRELERLQKYLEPRFLGDSLREINPRYLQGGAKQDFLWFQGLNDTHLFCWLGPDAKTIVKQQLIFLQFVVEWGENQPLRTGRVRQEAESSTTTYGWVKSELLDVDAEPQVDVLTKARLILESATIDPQVREEFLAKLKR